jgi:hypothetical protein
MAPRTRNALVGTALALLTVAFVSALGVVYSYHSAETARSEFARLLAGDTEVRIVAVAIAVPGGHPVRINEEQPLAYLTEMTRHATAFGDAGPCYTAVFSLSTGRSVECGLMVPVNADEITLEFPWHTLGDARWYAIRLRQPIPEQLDRLFHRMNPDRLIKLSSQEGHRMEGIPGGEEGG